MAPPKCLVFVAILGTYEDSRGVKRCVGDKKGLKASGLGSQASPSFEGQVGVHVL